MFSTGSKKSGGHTSSLTTMDGTTGMSENSPRKEFINSYKELTKKIETPNEFKMLAIDLVVDKISDGQFGTHKVFMDEIRYFLHYLLSVLEDDIKHGDQILKDSLVSFDNYIFSKYGKVEILQKNMQKLIDLSDSKRFSPNPKDNLLHYFVFLEENEIEVMEILRDFIKLLIPRESLMTKIVNFILRKKPLERKKLFD